MLDHLDMLEILGEGEGRIIGRVHRGARDRAAVHSKVEADDDQRIFVLTRREVRYRVYMVCCGVCGQAQGISTETPYRDEIVQDCVCGTTLVLPVEELR